MTPSRPAGVNRGDREPNAVTIAITDWTGHQDHTCPCLRGKEIEATGLDTLKFQDSLTLGHVLLTSGVHCLLIRVPTRIREQLALVWERKKLQVSLCF